MSEQENSNQLLPRLFIIASYHYKSAQHYAEQRDDNKMLLHSRAAVLAITILTEGDWKDYRNFCIKNKITNYKLSSNDFRAASTS